METSMLKTLAAKHSCTITKMARKYKTRITTDDGPRVCFQVTVPREGRKPLVARFGGIPLKRQPTAIINDRKPPQATTQGNELIHRLLAERCEPCESRTELQVHHSHRSTAYIQFWIGTGRPGSISAAPRLLAWMRTTSRARS
jgi:hypothetical protein